MSLLSRIGAAIENDSISIFQGAVSVIVASPIGAFLANEIKTLENSSVPISERLLQAATAAVPEILTYLGDPALLESQALSMGISAAQEVYNKVESTSAGMVALALLSKAGVTLSASITAPVVAAAGTVPVNPPSAT